MATQEQVDCWYEAGFRWFRYRNEETGVWTTLPLVGSDVYTNLGPTVAPFALFPDPFTNHGYPEIARRPSRRERLAGRVQQALLRGTPGGIPMDVYCHYATVSDTVSAELYCEFPPTGFMGLINLNPFTIRIRTRRQSLGVFSPPDNPSRTVPIYRPEYTEWFNESINDDWKKLPLIEPLMALTIEWPRQRQPLEQNPLWQMTNWR